MVEARAARLAPFGIANRVHWSKMLPGKIPQTPDLWALIAFPQVPRILRSSRLLVDDGPRRGREEHDTAFAALDD